MKPEKKIEEIKRWIRAKNEIAYGISMDLYSISYDENGERGRGYDFYKEYDKFIGQLLEKLDEAELLIKTTHDEIKREAVMRVLDELKDKFVETAIEGKGDKDVMKGAMLYSRFLDEMKKYKV